MFPTDTDIILLRRTQAEMALRLIMLQSQIDDLTASLESVRRLAEQAAEQSAVGGEIAEKPSP